MNCENLSPLLHGLYSHISRKRRLQLVFLLFVTLLGALMELVTIGAMVPFLGVLSNPEKVFNQDFLKPLFDLMNLKSPDALLVPVVLFFIGAACVSSATRLWLTKINTTISYGIGSDFYVYVYRKILIKPFAYHAQNNSSELIAAVNKAGVVVFTILYPLIQFASATIIAVFILAGLLMLDASTAIAAGLLFSVTYVLISMAIKRRLQKNGQMIAHAEGQRIRCIQEGLGGIRDIILDNSREVFINRFVLEDSHLRDARASNTVLSIAPRYVVEGVAMIVVAVVAYLMVLKDGNLIDALPVLGALALGAQKLIPMFQQIYQGWSQFNGNRAILRDVLDVLGEPSHHEIQGVQPKPMPLGFAEKIELDGLQYRYADDGPMVLDQLRLTINKGQKIGLIGKTGSGKSTLADLLMGLLSPTGGAIRVDGVALEVEMIPRWQQHIAHVPQAIYLSDANIAENIAFGVSPNEVDMARVMQAAKDAQLHDFVSGLAQGYQTAVGERGVRLSGGQRQRIGIARALYKGADVLFLDEATSALDNDTEAAVMASIQALRSDITVIIIAHRLTTLKCCDLIISLDKGQIEAQGSYEKLIGVHQ